MYILCILVYLQVISGCTVGKMSTNPVPVHVILFMLCHYFFALRDAKQVFIIITSVPVSYISRLGLLYLYYFHLYIFVIGFIMFLSTKISLC